MGFLQKSDNITKLRELLITLNVKEATNSQVDNMYATIRQVCKDGYWDWDLTGKYKYLSPSLKAQLGYEDDEVKNVEGALKEMIVEDDIPMLLNNLENHFKSGGEIEFKTVVRYKHKNGSIVKILCRGQVVDWGENGEPLRMVGSHVNVTDIT